jgi:hypothetical protein
VTAPCNLPKGGTTQYPFLAIGASGPVGQVRGTTRELVKLDVITREQFGQSRVQIPGNSKFVESFVFSDR